MTHEVSLATPYLHEGIDYTARFYTKEQGSLEALEFKKPLFEGFRVEERGIKEGIKEGSYTRYELLYRLYPLQIGELEIPSPVVAVLKRSLESNAFLLTQTQSQRIEYQAKPLRISVKPLPPEAQGITLVGESTIEVRSEREAFAPSTPVGLWVKIRSQGFLEALPEPLFSLPHATLYTKESSYALGVDEEGNAVREFHAHLEVVAKEAVVIPPLVIHFFDPKEARLREARSETIELQLQPKEGVSQEEPRASASKPLERASLAWGEGMLFFGMGMVWGGFLLFFLLRSVRHTSSSKRSPSSLREFRDAKELLGMMLSSKEKSTRLKEAIEWLEERLYGPLKRPLSQQEIRSYLKEKGIL